MKTSFKDFMGEQDRSVKHAIELIHHIAEEELIACHIESITKGKGSTFKIKADCHDRERPKGLQVDLTEKLNKRLMKQKFAGIDSVQVEVINK